MQKYLGFIVLGVILLLTSAIVFSGVGMVVNVYNVLVKSKQAAAQALNNLDTEYQRRYALIDNFVEILKQIKEFETFQIEIEQDIYVKTAEMKASATKMDLNIPEIVKQRISKENNLSNMLANLFDKIMVLAQHYPQISDPQIKDRKVTFEALNNLRQDLKSIEGDILNSRKNLNEAVRVYNQNIAIFPANLLAPSFGFKELEGFNVITEKAREDVKIKF